MWVLLLSPKRRAICHAGLIATAARPFKWTYPSHALLVPRPLVFQCWAIGRPMSPGPRQPIRDRIAAALCCDLVWAVRSWRASRAQNKNEGSGYQGRTRPVCRFVRAPCNNRAVSVWLTVAAAAELPPPPPPHTPGKYGNTERRRAAQRRRIRMRSWYPISCLNPVEFSETSVSWIRQVSVVKNYLSSAWLLMARQFNTTTIAP